MKYQSRKKKLSITIDDFRKVMGEELEFFQEKIIHNVNCHHCDSAYHSTIVDYQVEVNDLDDCILHGKCKTCGNPVNRYLETGENPKQAEAIEILRQKGTREIHKI